MRFFPRKTRSFLLLLTLMGASGCNWRSNEPLATLSTSTSIPKIIFSYSPTSIPDPTPTARPDPIRPTSTIEDRGQDCLSVGDEVPLENIGRGTVAFYDNYSPPYLLELGTHIRYYLPYENKNCCYISADPSPNRDYLAYMEMFTGSNNDPKYFKIRVADSKGKVFAEQTIDMNDISPYWRWINNDAVQMFSLSASQEGTVELFKPSKNELTKYTNVFPGLYQSNYLWPSKYMMEYSPDMEWVIYLTDPMSSSYGPVVMDIANQKTIWKALGSASFLDPPLWSPVGNQVAVVVDGELYIVNRDGQVVSPPGLTEDEQIESEKFAWSPNGRYIAFWAITIQDGIGHLKLYDLQNDLTIDYCIQDIGGGNSLIWSPDGTQFITNVVYQATVDQMKQYSLLVDINKNGAFKVLSKPKAWLNSEPLP